MANNILDSTFFNNTSYKSGKITLTVPDVTGTGTHEIVGLLVGDITFTLGVEWGPILPDATEWNQITQIMGFQNITSWIQSSAVAWKSSRPIEFRADFYLISYKSGADIKARAKELASLATLFVDSNDIFTGKVHGGYTVDYATTNDALLGAATFLSGNSEYVELDQSALKAMLGSKGTITVKVGDQMTFNNMLLDNISITPSTVQVAPKTPLFIRIEANFRSNRAPISKDLDSIFGENNITIIGNTPPNTNTPKAQDNYESPAGTDSTYGQGYPASGNPAR